jgi:hypothetical protein
MCTVAVIFAISAVSVAIGIYAVSKLRTAQLVAISQALQDRYFRRDANNAVDRTHPGDLEPMITYLDRVVDRQINKARGILPFNSVIIAVFSIERSRLTAPQVAWHIDLIAMLWFVIALLAISSFLCLSLFLVRWGEPANYGFDTEVAMTTQMIAKRSRKIEWATVLSEIALIVGAAIIIVLEFIPHS